MKLKYNCHYCKQSFQRYESTVSNPNRCFCSLRCKGIWQKESGINKGRKNPNFKHGGFTSNRKCYCGNKVDYRARQCWSCKLLKFSIDELREVVKTCKTFTEVATKLKASRTSVTKQTKKNNIDYSHFIPARKRNIPTNELLSVGNIRRATVKKRIVDENLIPYVCVICTLESIWMGNHLMLELDHINGDPGDNRLENLRFLCPNCHSQTPTNRGKNMSTSTRWEKCPR